MMKILSFGEILFDIFGEKEVIGGAPFNFSAHMSRLGGEVSLISAVGPDELGQKALVEVERYGIGAQHVAVCGYPTGKCIVTLREGTPSYSLVENSAYDHIPFPAITEGADAFYMGTLAARSEASRATLYRLLDTLSFEDIFFDINIRQNYYTDAVLQKGLTYATILKISREEMGVFGEYTIEELCLYLKERYPNIRLILVTLDKDGAYVYHTRSGMGIYSKKPRNKAVSTVGAGDSFSACFLYHYLNGEKVAFCLDRAIDLSDYVVTKIEAIPE